MKIRQFNVSDISRENTIRFDSNYLNYVQQIDNNDSIKLTDIYELIEIKSVDYPSDEDFKYCQIGDVNSNGMCNPVIINFEEQDVALDDYYKKISKGDIFKPNVGDILISKVRPYLKKIVYITEDIKDIYFTKAFICLRPKISPVVAYSMIFDNYINTINYSSRMGKGYPTINNVDLKQLKLSKKYYSNIIKNEKKIETTLKNALIEISSLGKNMVKLTDIINKEFDEYYATKTNLSRGMTYGTQKNSLKGISVINKQINNLEKFDNNIRLSFRSNNKEIDSIMEIIKSKPFLKIHDIYTEIVKGVQPEYSDDGIPVIKISNLKSEYIDDDFTEFASEEYTNKLTENKFVKPNDIIFCSIGKGSLGKVDIVEKNYNAILSTDNYILRINEKKYDPYFLTYYLRSNYGLAQFELYYTGATNQIHIYDYNVKDFIIPNIVIEEQKLIVNKVNDEYKKNKNNNNRINEIFNNIHCLLN